MFTVYKYVIFIHHFRARRCACSSCVGPRVQLWQLFVLVGTVVLARPPGLQTHKALHVLLALRQGLQVGKGGEPLAASRAVQVGGLPSTTPPCQYAEVSVE